MPRTARRTTPGGIYHVISRFADHRWFLRDAEERETYLRMFASSLEESDWRCLSYAVMSNHLHHAMVAGHLPMASWTRRVNPQFAQWMNRRHGRIGAVFASRATDIAFSASGLGTLLAYIHNNPVRAGVVERARDSTWTSHRAYLGLVQAPPWLRVEEGLRRAGFPDGATFDEWVDETPGERRDARYDEIQREARRRGTILLATPHADGDSTMVPLVAAPFAHLRPDPRMVIERVADITGVGVPLICSRRRIDGIRAARLLVVHAGIALGLTKSELAMALGISAQAVHVTSLRSPSDMEQRVIALVLDQVTVALQRMTA